MSLLYENFIGGKGIETQYKLVLIPQENLIGKPYQIFLYPLTDGGEQLKLKQGILSSRTIIYLSSLGKYKILYGDDLIYQAQININDFTSTE